MFRRIIYLPLGILCILAIISGCVAKKSIILPTKYDREMKISMYKACVKQATTFQYDARRPPEVIVRDSFNACRGQRASMLKEYPRRWREGMVRKVDEELYKNEIAWIMDKRS